MLKNIMFAAILALGLNAAAQDHGHSEEVCSALNAQVCAHLGHMSKLASGEVQFVAHTTNPGDVQVSDMKVVLWMPEMNHGSRPVKVTQFGTNKYKVTEAYFVMSGQWEVRLSFTLNDVQHQLNIPLAVE